MSAMGSAQKMGNRTRSSSVSPGPDDDTMSSIPNEPPDTRM